MRVDLIARVCSDDIYSETSLPLPHLSICTQHYSYTVNAAGVTRYAKVIVITKNQAYEQVKISSCQRRRTIGGRQPLLGASWTHTLPPFSCPKGTTSQTLRRAGSVHVSRVSFVEQGGEERERIEGKRGKKKNKGPCRAGAWSLQPGLGGARPVGSPGGRAWLRSSAALACV